MARVSDAHLEARKQSIMLAACDVFSRKGVEAATMAEIASAAGISPGAIYRYFPGKEDLARVCMDEGGDAVHAQWTANPDANGPHFAELARKTVAALNTPAERMATTLYLQRILQAVFAGDGGASIAEFYEEKRVIGKAIAARLEIERYAGRLPDGLDLQALADMLYTFYIGARLAKLVAPDTDVDAQLEQIITLFHVGSQASPAAAAQA